MALKKLWSSLRGLCYNEDRGNVVEYMFPVPGGKVTTGFWDLRPYSLPVEKRTSIHRAWDIAHDGLHDSKIVAPENGTLYYHYQTRCPLNKTNNLYWPDGVWYAFSNWFSDSMGGVIVLVGESGYTYVFGHLDVDIVFWMLHVKEIAYNWSRAGQFYDDYVQYVVTLDRPKTAVRGDVIGYIGHSGFSTGYHTHMQVHANRSYDSRIDPAELWPDVPISDNGAGPEKGPRPGAPHIPPAVMDLDYMRGA